MITKMQSGSGILSITGLFGALVCKIYQRSPLFPLLISAASGVVYACVKHYRKKQWKALIAENDSAIPKALEKMGISIDKTHPTCSSAYVDHLLTHGQEQMKILVEAGSVQVAIVQKGENNQQLWVLLKQTTNSLGAVSVDQMRFLKEGVLRVAMILPSAFGSAAYTEQLDCLKEKVGVRIFPCSKGPENELELQKKDIRTLDMLSLGALGRCPLPKHQQLEEYIAKVFSDSLPYTLPGLYPSDYVVGELNEALRFRVTTVLRIGHRSGYASVPQELSTAGYSESNFEQRKLNQAACVFCLSDVTVPFGKLKEKEIIYEGDYIRIVYNILPYIDRAGLNDQPEESAHILVLPKRHLTDCVGMNDHEQAEESRLILVLSNIATTMGKRPLIFAQRGVRAGQTVPHIHTHFLFLPKTFNGSMEKIAAYFSRQAAEQIGNKFGFVQQQSPQLKANIEKRMKSSVA